RSRNKKESLRLRRERLHPASEAVLDPAGQRLRIEEPEAAGELGRCQSSRKLLQRERISSGLGPESLEHLLVEPTRYRRPHRRAPASPAPRPSTTSSGKPSISSASLASRTANTIAIGSASRRRATNDSAATDSRSSHCTSSTRQTSGCASATSETRLSVARLTRKLSGAGPSVRPNARNSASRCGAGSCSARPS